MAATQSFILSGEVELRAGGEGGVRSNRFVGGYRHAMHRLLLIMEEL